MKTCALKLPDIHTRDVLGTPFLGAYLALAGVALLSMAVMAGIRFPAEQVRERRIPADCDIRPEADSP